MLDVHPIGFRTPNVWADTAHAGRRQHRGKRHVVSLRGLTIVAVMQAADLRRDNDLPGRGTRRPAVRGVFAQAEMRAAPMVVGEIRAKHAAEIACG